jgi:hypothetical protein
VFVERNGGYVGVPISLGSYSDNYSEVTAGDIDEGEPIVLNPPDELTGESAFSPPGGSGFSGFGN